MAALTVQQIAAAGTIPAYTAAAGGGDSITPADGRTFLHVKNAGVGPVTVTIDSKAAARAGLAQADTAIVVGAGAEKMISIDPAGFADDTGKCDIAYSGVTSVTVAAIRL